MLFIAQTIFLPLFQDAGSSVLIDCQVHFFLLYDGIDVHSFYAFHDLMNFAKYRQVFCRMPSVLVCVMIPYDKIGYNVWLEYHRSLAAFSVHRTRILKLCPIAGEGTFE